MFKFSSQIIPGRFWKRPMIRKTQQMLRGARWRRRNWRLLEGNAGDRNGRVLFALQVRNWITFQLRSYRYDLSVTISCSKDKVMFETFKSISLKESAKEHANIEILLRDLDLAFHRPFCYGGLCSRRRWLLQRIILTKCLQQWWLISIYLCLW